ncbi:hypothetical protein ABH922_003043 [Rhodococcus sp. 27YEA15]|uniref:hypothetical protein n=1 Tax=Rhodococcus sp. 27YEA15 TaxID=3156259 RepID=UPI003C7A10E9
MSRGQRPRVPEFFPLMKYRARKRNFGRTRMFIYGADMKPIWPQVFRVDGREIPPTSIKFISQHGERTLTASNRTPYWISPTVGALEERP